MNPSGFYVNPKSPLKYAVKQSITKFSINTKKPPNHLTDSEASIKKRRLPTLPLLRSTIGVTRLNFSVRNGRGGTLVL